ncbi:pentapeptide repeat-containing protein [Hymenobacter negativus]|uniref:Pentapeptide repeat-containing protein n=1 Tax=Hymenobacter negativus TaxID=2795026 RepID=A0ABS3QPH9_9BACT|nr:pentapeptide repeat-containing protein [Hymenobacter negativus]MBO2012981.1 pentapeptide repeat-containing protein [Hymenobacter negativus]
MTTLPPFLGKFSFQSTSPAPQNYLTAIRLPGNTYLPGMAAAAVTDLETCLVYGDSTGSVVQLGNQQFLALNVDAGQLDFATDLADAALLQLGSDLSQQTWQLDAFTGWQTVYYSNNSVTPYLTINDVNGVLGYYSLFNATQVTPGTAAIQAAGQAQQADLTTVCLAGADFTGVNFTGANFSSADLTGTKFNNANLTGATFTGAILSGTQFDGATLDTASFTTAATDISAVNWGVPASARGILLTGCQGAGTVLGNATTVVDFTNANLVAATLTGAVLDNLNLTGANLSGCLLAQGASGNSTNFTKANLVGLVAADSSFQNAIFAQATCYGAVFTRANLSGTTFQSAQLGAKQELFTLPTTDAAELNGTVHVPTDVSAAFSNAGITLATSATVVTVVNGQNWRIENGDDTYSILLSTALQQLVVYQYGSTAAADLTGALLTDAVFTSANLFAANLAGVSWTGSQASGSNADFESANLSGALLLEASFNQAQFLGTQASQSLFLQASLAGAHLGPDLNNVRANFAGAQFQGTDFTNATLNQVVFTNAAIALPTGVPLLILPLSYEAYLQSNNLVPVQQYFAAQGYPMSAQATLANQSAWTIVDAATSTTYLVDANYYVSNAGTSKRLFQLSPAVQSTLAQAAVSGPLAANFITNGYPLSIGDTITNATNWVITNVNDTCSAKPVIYQFYQLCLASDGVHAFGTTELWLANTPLYEYGIAVGATTAYQAAIDAGSLCPNGYPANYPGLSWEQMLTTGPAPF